MQLSAGLAAVVSLVRSKGIATNQQIAAALESAVIDGERTAAAKASAKQDQDAAKCQESCIAQARTHSPEASDESQATHLRDWQSDGVSAMCSATGSRSIEQLPELRLRHRLSVLGLRRTDTRLSFTKGPPCPL
jgi:hypothetical protein